MSVRTTADDCLTRVKNSVNDSITDLSEVVINRVWGSDDFGPEYKKTLLESLMSLIKIRDALR